VTHLAGISDEQTAGGFKVTIELVLAEMSFSSDEFKKKSDAQQVLERVLHMFA